MTDDRRQRTVNSQQSTVNGLLSVVCRLLTKAALCAVLGTGYWALGTDISHAMDRSEIEERFRQGNAFYEAGDYPKAVQEYSKIVAAGMVSGPLYYNLGNACLKTGDLGHAMLYYRRAKRLMPRDADLSANYNYARAMIKGNLPEERGLWAWTPLRSYNSRFTVNELTLLSSVFYIAAVALLIAFLYFPALSRYLLPAVSVLFILALLNSTVTAYSARAIGKLAVVTAGEAESKFGPFDSATKFFTLYEGMGVRVLRCDNDWCKVRRSDGKVGWVRRGAVEII